MIHYSIVVHTDDGGRLGPPLHFADASTTMSEVRKFRLQYPDGWFVRVYGAGEELFSVRCGEGDGLPAGPAK